MRKKKKKYANLLMLLLILFVMFYIVIEQNNIKITADELIESYISSQKEADNKFLDKELELTGEVKSFIQFESEKSLLQLNTTNDKFNLYCLLINKETETIAASLTTGTEIKVFGKCLGLNPLMSDKLSNSIFIEVEKIK